MKNLKVIRGHLRSLRLEGPSPNYKNNLQHRPQVIRNDHQDLQGIILEITLVESVKTPNLHVKKDQKKNGLKSQDLIIRIAILRTIPDQFRVRIKNPRKKMSGIQDIPFLPEAILNVNL